jgi:hypothetical protein
LTVLGERQRKIVGRDYDKYNCGELHYDRILMVKLERVHEKQAIAWNLRTSSSSSVGLRQTTEDLDIVGHSQDLPYSCRILASSLACKDSNFKGFLVKMYNFGLQIFVCFPVVWGEKQESGNTFLSNAPPISERTFMI